MIYRDFQDLKLSQMAMGTMRLPVIDGVDANIDEAEAQKMFDIAMERGVNYYDTAWGYHEGNSQKVVGRCLVAKYPRESFYLANKFPGYDLANMGKAEEIFEEQLKLAQTDYFDFYLIHNVCELNIDEYLNPEHGIKDYFVRQKEAGRIKHLGFSIHGSMEVMERFMEAYGDAMEFCQIQLNYLDWEFQKANEKVAYLREHELPIMVMEPMRGGRLCQLTDEEFADLQALRPEETQAGWSLRWLQSIPGVVTILSGASSPEQISQNITTFEEDKPLSEEEMKVLADLASRMYGPKTLPCTGCRYCTTHCPMELDIPELLSFYNEHTFTENGFIAPMALASYDENKKPSACIACGSCETVCPQQIKISKAMADFDAMLH